MYHVIYGPPGTGKSTEIIKRVNHYKDTLNYSEKEIGLCSYTKAAAQVLSSRCKIKNKWIGTVHSLAFKLAGCAREQTITYEKYKELETLTGIEIVGADPNMSARELANGDYYIALYNQYKATLSDSFMDIYDRSEQPGTRDEFEYFINTYINWKETYGYIDFNDMLTLALDEKSPELKVLFVDEAQDLSKLQWKLVNKWALSIEHVYIAGDDDQSIYEWAGADTQGMSKFEQKHKAKKLVLNQSYRLPKKVFDLANKLTGYIPDRVEKEFNPREEEGSITYYGDIYHIPKENIQHGDDLLILYRNHSIRKEIEEYLIQSALPYIADNGKPGMCQSKEFKAIKLYLNIQVKGERELKTSETKLLTDVMHPCLADKFGTEEMMEVFKTYGWQEALSIRYDYVPYFTALLYKWPDLDIEPTIHISTIHGAKGKEADKVILFNGMGQKTAEKFSEGKVESEVRVFYVAVTRTKKELYIIQHDNPFPML